MSASCGRERTIIALVKGGGPALRELFVRGPNKPGELDGAGESGYEIGLNPATTACSLLHLELVGTGRGR